MLEIWIIIVLEIGGHDILIHYRLSTSLFLEEEEKKKDFLENFACVLELLIFIEIVVVFPTRAPQYISKISNKQELQLSSASPKAKKTLRAFIDNGRAYILGQMLATTRRVACLLKKSSSSSSEKFYGFSIVTFISVSITFTFPDPSYSPPI